MTPNEAIISIAQNISNWWAAIRTERASKKGWSTSGKITLVGNAVATGQPRSRGSASLQVNFPKVGYYTIQFSITPIGNWAIDIVRRAKATITWSVEGNSVRREIEVVDGTSISGTATAVNISIVDDSNVFFPVTADSVYVVSAQVTPGTRPTYGNSQPPMLLPDTNNGLQVALPAATARTFDIPQQSGVNQVFFYFSHENIPASLESVEINFIAPGGPTEILARTFADLVVGQWVPLPPGTNDIIVENNSAAAIRVLPIFGIEG